MTGSSKKIAALILTAMMAAAAFTGCGGSTDETSVNNKTASGASTPDIVISSSTESKSSAKSKSSAESTSSTESTSGTESKSSTESTSGTESTSSAESTVSTDNQSDYNDTIIDINDAETVEFIKNEMKKEAVDGKISLKLWCAGSDLEFEKRLANEFAAKFSGDGINIKVDLKGAIGEDAAGGKIIESPESAADVFNFADDQLSLLVNADAVAAVPDFFKKTVNSTNTEDSIAVCTVDNKIYAYPKTSDNGFFMYYDKRIFSEDEVGNMDEMIAKAKDSGKNVFMDLGNAWYNSGFFFAAGCKIEYKDGVQTAEFGNENGLKAAKAMCHIAENQGNGFAGAPGTLGDNAFVQQGFESGELAAAVIGAWEGPAIANAIGAENVGAVKLPTVLMDDEQVQLHSFGGYKLVGVNKYSKAQFSANVLAYYLTMSDSQLKRYTSIGCIPTNNDAINGELNGMKVSDDPAFKAIEAQQPYSHPMSSSVGSKYWASGVGILGGEIVTSKGMIDDDSLNIKLRAIEGEVKE